VRPAGNRSVSARSAKDRPHAFLWIGHVAILVLLLTASGCRKGGTDFRSDRPTARATLSADSAGLGDPVVLRLEAIVPRGARVSLVSPGDSLAGWRILRAEPPRQDARGGWDHWKQALTIAAYHLGETGPDTLRIVAKGARGDSLMLAYAPSPLRIGGVLKPGEPTDPSKVRDIRDVMSTGMPLWPWVVAAAVFLAAGIWFAIARIRARRRRIPAEAEPPPGPTPEEEFEAAIEALLAEGLLERGLYREFYYGVSRAVRLYLERKSGLPLLESTSAEVFTLLEPMTRGDFERIALKDWLSEGDLVKYARMDRLQAESNRYLLKSRELVRTFARSHEEALS
jgi:hypothetical protein